MRRCACFLHIKLPLRSCLALSRSLFLSLSLSLFCFLFCFLSLLVFLSLTLAFLFPIQDSIYTLQRLRCGHSVVGL